MSGNVKILFVCVESARRSQMAEVEMDYLITMGCEEACPAVLSRRVLEWNIPDPKGKSIEMFRDSPTVWVNGQDLEPGAPPGSVS